jgi:hypothetical protein
MARSSGVVIRRDLRRRRKPAVRAPRNAAASLAARQPLPAAFVTARPIMSDSRPIVGSSAAIITRYAMTTHWMAAENGRPK